MTHAKAGRCRIRWALLAAWVALAAASCERGATEGVTDVAPGEVLALVRGPEGALLLDVRSPEESARGHVPGAVNIPHTELAERLDEIREHRDRGVVVYCESGRRAGVAAEVLLEAGFPRVMHLEGDMSGWRAAGREIER